MEIVAICRRNLGLALLLTGLALAVSLAAAQGLDAPRLDVTVTDSGVEAPESVEAGFYTFAPTVDTSLEVDMSIGRIADGATVDDVLAAVEAVNASFMGQGNPGEAMARVDELTSLVGGAAHPEGTVVELAPGEYLILSVGANEEGQSHIELGIYTTVTVTEAATQADAPAADLTVDMSDFAFSIPDEVPAGAQVWEVVNVGEQVHHMELLKVMEGHTIDEVMAFLEREEGEAPVEPFAYVPIIDSDERNFLPLDLTPGSYIALCFMPDYETGMPHVAMGMVDTFTVPAN